MVRVCISRAANSYPFGGITQELIASSRHSWRRAQTFRMATIRANSSYHIQVADRWFSCRKRQLDIEFSSIISLWLKQNGRIQLTTKDRNNGRKVYKTNTKGTPLYWKLASPLSWCATSCAVKSETQCLYVAWLGKWHFFVCDVMPFVIIILYF